MGSTQISEQFFLIGKTILGWEERRAASQKSHSFELDFEWNEV